jgi:hypothetical protein
MFKMESVFRFVAYSLLIVTILTLVYYKILCKLEGTKQHSRVSISKPPWCPSNVDCSAFVREKAKKLLRKYLMIAQNDKSEYIYSENYAINILKLDTYVINNDTEFHDAIVERFILEFRDYLPYMRLAKDKKVLFTYYIN